MKQFVVGGAVRDILLGESPNDIDFVWVGATPNDLLDLNMSQVGADFPVFLDKNGNEHALARTERKNGNGYNGFECEFNPSVTLKDDQFRRDITINQLAVAVEKWGEFVETANQSLVVDSFGGIADLNAGIIRHVSKFFQDDPVRILRVCRQAARFNFRIADDTIELMTRMSHSGDLDHLTAERIWLETEKAMKGKRPGDFFRILDMIGAFKKVMPVLATLGENVACAVDKVSGADARCAVMGLGLGPGLVGELFDSLKAPAHIKKLAVKTEQLRKWIGSHALSPAILARSKLAVTAKPLTAEAAMKIFTQLDVKRAPADFDFCVDTFSQLRRFDTKSLMKAKEAFLSVSFGDIPDGDQLDGQQIADELNLRRRVVVQQSLGETQ